MPFVFLAVLSISQETIAVQQNAPLANTFAPSEEPAKNGRLRAVSPRNQLRRGSIKASKLPVCMNQSMRIRVAGKGKENKTKENSTNL